LIFTKVRGDTIRDRTQEAAPASKNSGGMKSMPADGSAAFLEGGTFGASRFVGSLAVHIYHFAVIEKGRRQASAAILSFQIHVSSHFISRSTVAAKPVSRAPRNATKAHDFVLRSRPVWTLVAASTKPGWPMPDLATRCRVLPLGPGKCRVRHQIMLEIKDLKTLAH
jgi:hypothetical protein